MADPSLAEMLLILARRDEGAFLALAADPLLHDSLCGFHAQQAVEKALKAVLTHAGIAYRRTHDIAELLDLAADAGLPAPPQADRLDELNPYGVEYRYGLLDPVGLDRMLTARVLSEVLAWAEAILSPGAAAGGP